VFHPGASGQDTAGKAGKPGVHPDAIRLIDAWLEATQAHGQLPSLVASVVKGDRVVFARGYGYADRQGTVPATPETIYSICSISKLFTSIAVMQLQESGRLRLDDEIAAHLPEFRLRQPDESSAPVTIRSVLMHASGLPREAVGDYWTGPDFRFPARDEMLSALSGQDMFERSLARHQYSNLGIALLGEIVARVSGEPYDRYVQSRILDPLRMTSTSPRVPDALRGTRLAVGHGARKRDGTREPLGAFDARGLQPAAGFSSTVGDLSTFVLWQLRVLRSGKAEILRPSSLREMQRIQWTDPDGKATWGLGFVVLRSGSDVVVGHGGWCPGYRAAVAVVPAKEIGVVVAMNSMDSPLPIWRGVLELAQMTPTNAVGANGDGEAPVLADYAGRYSFQPWSAETVVVPWGSDLAALTFPIEKPKEELRILRHVGQDRFRLVRDDKSLAETYSFLRDGKGRVQGLRIWAATATRVD
jgi:CubicO group peptidase (beta-lactamase class C family)